MKELDNEPATHTPTHDWILATDSLQADLYLREGMTVYDALIAIMRNAGVGFGDIVALAESLPDI